MNVRHDALSMDFPDEKSARLAEETFDELGYDPVRREGCRVYIHVRNEDLVSALEIMEACGGCLTPAGREAANLANQAYGLEEIPIPAHTVNEDWTDAYADGHAKATSDQAPGRTKAQSAHANGRAEAQGAQTDGRTGAKPAPASGRPKEQSAQEHIGPERLAMLHAQDTHKPHHGEEPFPS